MQLDDRLVEPEFTDRIERPRLDRRIAGTAAAQVTVLLGPAGSGKGAVLRARPDFANTIYYRVGKGRASFGRFVHGLAEVIAPWAPGARASFPRAWERALQSDSPAVVLARWLTEHLADGDRPIAIDDLHDASNDLGIAAFIGELAELRPSARLTIAARGAGALPIALWMATGRMERPIDEADLRFDRAEFVAAADHFGVSLADSEVDHLLEATRGSPVAVAFTLTELRAAPRRSSSGPVPASFADIAERIFCRRTGRERTFLFTAALFPNIDDGLLALCGWDEAAQVRGAIGGDGSFMWESQGAGAFRFFDRFREYLLGRFQSRDAEFQSTIANRVVATLGLAGRYADALEVATAHGLIDVIAELLDARGFEIMESGESDVIREALAAGAAASGSLGAHALALRGYMEARAGHLDTAEAWFRLGLDTAEDEASRAAIALYYARELAVQRREDAFEVLEPFVDSLTLPPSILIDVRSAFAQALVVAKHRTDAAARMDQALAQLEPDSPPALRARVFARAAYVALECNSFDLARERATIAAPLALAQCLYDVAASTYSVLYNIAYDIDDDAAAAVRHLMRLREVGAKSGTLRLDLYALLSRYELYAEAGDEAMLFDLDCQLRNIDKHDANNQIHESLLPAHALQAGWAGDFDAAQRLLRPTADRHATPGRQALCWARIGLYCAAANDTERAQQAFAKAHEARVRSDLRTTHLGLALLNLALAAFISGDVARARQLMRASDDPAIVAAPRLCALRGVIQTMIAAWDDPHRFAVDLREALAGLWVVAFGGMAKLIEALPHPFAHGLGGQRQTIGSVLAAAELSARFALAVESDAAGSLRSWLDTLSGAAFNDLKLTERLDAWAAEHTGLDRRGRAVLADVRRQVESYRRPAPALIGPTDDIDATIDDLFVRLDLVAPLMAEHSRAVSAWCARLARVMGLPESQITFVSRCGLIHDIGKMRTPPDILSAPRALSPAEWTIMRDHAAEGGRIIAALPQLRALVPIVRGHHERLDGKGYPDGLRSTAIPLAARIVSVADSFNAMIGRRPYRLPLAPTDALHELERNCGTQFDPEVVEALVRIVLRRHVQSPPKNLARIT